MATRIVRCPLPGGYSPDINDHAAAIPRMKTSVGTKPTNGTTLRVPSLSFDAAVDQGWYWSLGRLPDDYTSGGLVRLLWGAAVTTGNVIWAATSVQAEPSSGDLDALSLDTVAAASATAVPGTSEQWKETTITLTSTGADLGDLLVIFVKRDADAAGDTAAGLAYLYAAQYEYTA